MEKYSFKVLRSGYLANNVALKTPGYVEALDKSANGEDPGIYDNSPHYRIHPNCAGQTAYIYANNILHLMKFQIKEVELSNGLKVSATADSPLAWARWGKVTPPPEELYKHFLPHLIAALD